MIKKLLIALMILTGSMSLKSQKIFMLGDSHVFAKIYPEKTAEVIRQKYPDMQFNFWGKNGAEFSTYNTHPEYLDSLYAFAPEILIVHLGTNDSYGFTFNKEQYINEMEIFYRNLKDTLPECKIVIVTPFINKRWLNKKRTKWRVNANTTECAQETLKFAADHADTYVIDNNADAGMSYLKDRRLIRKDNVHLTEEGYGRLGQQVADSLLLISDLWVVSPSSQEETEYISK